MQQYNHSRYRRQRPPPQPIVLQPGQIAYRIVCHWSIIGGLIGPSGSIISEIRRDTCCTVHCDEQVQGSQHRTIMVVGSASSGRKIALKSTNAREDEEEREIVSTAQEAVIRVCERMWEVDAERGGMINDTCEGYCGLLADTTQIGAVVGREGKNVSRMRRESGAHIRILPAPHCASKDDQLIQITGTALAVKKALLLVTECLHDCPPYERDPMSLAKPLERASHFMYSDPHAEFFPHLSLFLPPLNGNCANSYSSDAGEAPNRDVDASRIEVSFRVLCSNGAAGSIIGKKGTIVRTLQNETGASIMFTAPLTMTGERVVTISAWENLESWYSPAQNAVVLVFSRSVEHDIEKGYLSGSLEGVTVTAKLLASSDDVCCLNGKGGDTDSEMTEVSGADIRILKGRRILDCASEDVVIEITGKFKNVQNALFMVTGKLRGNLLPSKVLNEVRTKSAQRIAVMTSSPRLQQSAGLSLESDQEACLTRGMNQLRFSTSLDNTSLPGLQPIQTAVKGSTTFEGNEELRSYNRNRSPTVVNMVLELLVSEDVLGSVYGEDGRNLAQLRQISGAKVEVGDPSPGKNERTVVISGSPDQTKAAQTLLQAFILAGQ